MYLLVFSLRKIINLGRTKISISNFIDVKRKNNSSSIIISSITVTIASKRRIRFSYPRYPRSSLPNPSTEKKTESKRPFLESLKFPTVNGPRAIGCSTSGRAQYTKEGGRREAGRRRKIAATTRCATLCAASEMLRTNIITTVFYARLG